MELGIPGMRSTRFAEVIGESSDAGKKQPRWQKQRPGTPKKPRKQKQQQQRHWKQAAAAAAEAGIAEATEAREGKVATADD